MRLNFQFIETGKALDSLKIVQIPKVNCFYWSEHTKNEYIFIVGVESESPECDKIVIYIYIYIYTHTLHLHNHSLRYHHLN